jgi:hypothetical protein
MMPVPVAPAGVYVNQSFGGLSSSVTYADGLGDQTTVQRDVFGNETITSTDMFGDRQVCREGVLDGRLPLSQFIVFFLLESPDYSSRG